VSVTLSACILLVYIRQDGNFRPILF